jgi:glucose-1-phosphate cytidylyltransferase
VKVVLLCGGKGTRIRDVSEDLPKPMIPIGRDPILRHIMAVYGACGHHDFVLCLGHLGWRIRHYFTHLLTEGADVELDFRRGGRPRVLEDRTLPPWRVTLAETGAEAMTGARLKRVQRYVGQETFLLTYGDGLADVDLDAVVAFHRSHGKLATVTAVRPPSRFGELELDGDEVASFQEKPQVSEGRINGGYFVLEPQVFDYLTADDDCVFERRPLQQLAADGQMMAFRHDGFWMPMDTPREHARLNEIWASGSAPWAPEHLPRRTEAGASRIGGLVLR